jgi:hypothetical protein
MSGICSRAPGWHDLGLAATNALPLESDYAMGASDPLGDDPDSNRFLQPTVDRCA